jgi:hypothetical protein
VTSSATTSSSTDPSPIIRSGLEVLSGHQSSSSSHRDLLFGGFRPPQLPPSLSYPGFPGGSSFPSHLSANPFWASFMSGSSSVCRDPLCGDPFCPTALRNQQLFAAATGRLSASSALSNYSSLFSAAAAVQVTFTSLIILCNQQKNIQNSLRNLNEYYITNPKICRWKFNKNNCFNYSSV